MQLTSFVLGAAILLGLTTTARAEDCGTEFGCGADDRVGEILLYGVPYAAVTVGMGIKDLASDDHSVAYGYAETIIHAPLAVVWSVAAVDDLTSSSGGDAAPWFFGVAALHTALVAHGVYTIVRDRSAPAEPAPGRFQVGRVTAAVAPTPVQGGAGLGIGGTF